MKKPLMTMSLIVACIAATVSSCSRSGVSSDPAPQGSVKTIFTNRGLELEGKKLYINGLYDEALKKFEEADLPKYRLYPDALNGYARVYIRRIYWVLNEYEKALENAVYMVGLRPDIESTVEDKKMFEALIQWRNARDPEPIYKFIEELKTSHADMLPPNAYKFGASLYIANILRLYDTIGDYDAGIAFIDEFLEFAYQKNPTVKQVKSSNEALALSQLRQTDEDRRNRRSYEILREYFLVREGFEQDKAEGKHGPEPGKPGRATQAIIQSEYFPG